MKYIYSQIQVIIFFLNSNSRETVQNDLQQKMLMKLICFWGTYIYYIKYVAMNILKKNSEI